MIKMVWGAYVPDGARHGEALNSARMDSKRLEKAMQTFLRGMFDSKVETNQLVRISSALVRHWLHLELAAEAPDLPDNAKTSFFASLALKAALEVRALSPAWGKFEISGSGDLIGPSPLPHTRCAYWSIPFQTVTISSDPEADCARLASWRFEFPFVQNSPPVVTPERQDDDSTLITVDWSYAFYGIPALVDWVSSLIGTKGITELRCSDPALCAAAVRPTIVALNRH